MIPNFQFIIKNYSITLTNIKELKARQKHTVFFVKT